MLKQTLRSAALPSQVTPDMGCGTSYAQLRQAGPVSTKRRKDSTSAHGSHGACTQN